MSMVLLPVSHIYEALPTSSKIMLPSIFFYSFIENNFVLHVAWLQGLERWKHFLWIHWGGCCCCFLPRNCCHCKKICVYCMWQLEKRPEKGTPQESEALDRIEYSTNHFINMTLSNSTAFISTVSLVSQNLLYTTHAVNQVPYNHLSKCLHSF